MRKTLNKLKIFINYLTGRPVSTIYPSQVALELTSHCNLACTICPHKKMQRPKGSMSYEAFCAFVDKVKKHAEFVYLYGIGESLINQDTDRMIDYAQAAGIFTYLSTNAALMTEQWSTRLLKSALRSITFAFDGCTKEEYERIRVKADFDAVLANIKAFLRLKKTLRSKMEVVVQLVLTDANQGDPSRFAALFTEEELSQINRIRVKPFYDSFPDVHTRQSPPHRKCFFLWNFLFVYHDGRAGLCCVDYDGQTILGDLNQQAVGEIWNSRELNRIRRAHHDRQWENLPLCRACSLPDVSGLRLGVLLLSSIVPTGFARKFLPLYEKLFLHKHKKKPRA